AGTDGVYGLSGALPLSSPPPAAHAGAGLDHTVPAEWRHGPAQVERAGCRGTGVAAVHRATAAVDDQRFEVHPR
ncbi:hypothetical protein HaLaN_24579, partial [Haematococcus lacustris]